MLTACGWMVALVLAGLLVAARRRLEAIARADHEVRGGLCTLSLALDSLGREPNQSELVRVLRTALDRAVAGADALSRTRGPVRLPEPLMLERWIRESASAHVLAAGSSRAVEVDWRAGDVALETDRLRLAEIVPNLLGNALEHGSGTVTVVGSATPTGVRIEVSNEGRDAVVVPVSAGRSRRRTGRGRGLQIADRAARELGSGLQVDRADGAFTVGFDLPVARR